MYTIVIRYSDGRPARMYDSETDTLFIGMAFSSQDGPWIKAFDVYHHGEKIYSWVLKRG